MPKWWLWITLSTICLAFSSYYGLIVAPIGHAAEGRRILPDLYPIWNGSRHVLILHDSPYSAEVTAENQLAMYGRVLPGKVEQQCAYPAFAAFLLAPFVLLPFSAAQYAFVAVFFILTPLSAVWWSGGRFNAPLTTLLVLSSYPVLLALQLRQPTLLFLPLVVAATLWAGPRPVLAGVLLALASTKPQFAISACIPLLFWAGAHWRKRAEFAYSFAIAEIALFGAATFLVPGWFPEWLISLRNYGRYNDGSLIVMAFGTAAGSSISIILAAVVVFVCWTKREDLPFSVSFSLAAMQVLLPFQTYNDVMLIVPIMWIAVHVAEIRAFGDIHQMLVEIVRLILGLGFVVMTGLGMLGVFAPLTAARCWKLPLTLYGILPPFVLAVLLACAISTFWRSRLACLAPAVLSQTSGDDTLAGPLGA